MSARTSGSANTVSPVYNGQQVFGPAGTVAPLGPVARHVSGPAGRHPLPRWPSRSQLSSRLNVTGCPAGRHPLQCHRFYCSSADPLHVSGPAGRLLVTSADPLAVTAGRLLVTFERHRLPRWPSPVARHPLAGCSSADPLHVSGPAGRLLVTFERHRLHVTSADPVAHAGRHRLHVTRWPVARQRTRWPSPAGRLLVRPAGRLLVTSADAAGRHRWPVARHV